MLVGRNPKTPTQIVEYYQGPVVNFYSNQSFNPDSNPSLPQYSVDQVHRGAWGVHVGNPLLSSFLPQNILMTSFSVGSAGQPWNTALFSNLVGPGLQDAGIADAATASSAMPGMLGSWTGELGSAFVDGGFANHDPTLAAIAAAVHSGIALESISAITIGTGYMSNWIASATKTWGAQQWQNGDGNPNNNTPALLINGTISPVLNASLNGTSTTLMPQLAGMLLGNRYTNINPPIPFIAENDVSQSALAELVCAANGANLSAAETILANYWPS
jgi:patatin-like phospholipase/acyl hydrolase